MPQTQLKNQQVDGKTIYKTGNGETLRLKKLWMVRNTSPFPEILSRDIFVYFNKGGRQYLVDPKILRKKFKIHKL